MIRLLIDECLTPDLVEIARARWVEAEHLSRIGRAGTADWRVVNLALSSDYTLVTNNARDFRRLYRRLEMHAGLVIILPQGRAADQIRLFRLVLDHLETMGDTVNQLVEIDSDGRITAVPWVTSEQ